MSLETARAFLFERAPELVILETSESTATVAEAALVHNVQPGQIAKTLSFRTGEEVIVLVMSGDSRIDNKKFKDRFGTKAKMLPTDEVLQLTGHPVGGVCPFGLKAGVHIYADASLKLFDVVIPAAGASNTGVRVAPDHLVSLVGAEWVDVAQDRSIP